MYTVAINSSIPCCPSLPVELWYMVVSFADERSQWQLRLVSKQLNQIATPKCFSKVRIQLRRRSIARLVRIAQHEKFRLLVKTLVYQKQRELPSFDNFEEWESDLDLPEEPDESLKLISDSEWRRLPLETRMSYYREYKAEQAFPSQFAKNVRFYPRVNTQAPGWVWPAYAMPEIQLARVELESVVLRLENVASLEIEEEPQQPTMDHTYLGRLRWLSCTQDDEYDTARLSLILRALGWANCHKRNQGLRNMQLQVIGRGFWSPSSVRDLWAGLVLQDAAATDDMALSASDFRDEVQFSAQFAIMWQSLARLSDLDFSIERPSTTDIEGTRIFIPNTQLGPQDGGPVTSADLAAGDPKDYASLGMFLQGAKSVERVKLRIQEHGKMRFRPAHFQHSRADLLHFIHWPRLRTMHLTMITTQPALLAFLQRHAPTLRELEFDGVRLSPSLRRSGSDIVVVPSSWETVFANMASSLQLEKVRLIDLVDLQEGKAKRDILPRSARQDCTNTRWVHYETPIIDYVLLGHEEFLAQHLPGCESCKAKANSSRASSSRKGKQRKSKRRTGRTNR